MGLLEMVNEYQELLEEKEDLAKTVVDTWRDYF